MNKNKEQSEASLFQKINKGRSNFYFTLDLSLDHSDKKNSIKMTLKQRTEPLIISDTIDDEDEEAKETKETKGVNQIAEKERLIEEFNSGHTQTRIFTPKKGTINHTAPDLNLNKIVVKPVENNVKNITTVQPENKKIIKGKADDKIRNNSTMSKDNDQLIISKPKINDDSQTNSQKDVIVRKIKKKNDSIKVASSTAIGFGHK